MKAAVVAEDGSVLNVIVADAGEDMAPEGCILIAIDDESCVSPGWRWNGHEFVFPDEDAPEGNI